MTKNVKNDHYRIYLPFFFMKNVHLAKKNSIFAAQIIY